jgi:hypothetical protein
VSVCPELTARGDAVRELKNNWTIPEVSPRNLAVV